ncbi:hypothetical protein [Roseinatronobacter alkalisoli]|uniref:Uncharacterized protein n=1 Tax=Roseinatronobacter alkalisoli TaxID=3028235 RepID=A0ABT5TCT5_9RHOB|nr:hypothetical protein [Roseinatronobacter sp. HJB301]MDD7972784.1 hypothetical protein [Roseinatronobacter sp. HJB301]
MTPKFAIPLIVALGTSTAVMAQEAPAEPDSGFGTTNVPFDWDDETRSAFFSDPETGGLLSDDEITENWANLTLEQQDIVLQHCDGIGTDDTGFDDAQEEPPVDGAAPATDDTFAEPDIGAPDDLGATGDDPDIAHLCSLIEDQ